MRYVCEVAVAKNIRQTVWAAIRLRHDFRRPKVAPPGYKRQRKENCDGNRYKNCWQNFSSPARNSRRLRPPDTGNAGALARCPLARRTLERKRLRAWRSMRARAPAFPVSSGLLNSKPRDLRDPKCLIEVSLERSSSADVQGNAMKPTAQHFGVPQF